MSFWAVILSFWAIAAFQPLVRRQGLAKYLPTLGLLAATFAYGQEWVPWQRLVSTGLILLFTLKGIIASNLACPRGIGHLLYFTAWPGMDPRPFANMSGTLTESGRRFAKGWWKMLWGFVALIIFTLLGGTLHREVFVWGIILALVFTVHFGYAGVLSGSMQLAGYPVRPLFDDPLLANSLTDFWTRRWNRAFVEMNRLLFMPPIARRFGVKTAVFGLFLVSGLLHELAISYPVGTGYGLPLLYFLLQAGGMFLERGIKQAWLKRAFAWVLILAPMPLLFHSAFREEFVYRPFMALSAQLHNLSLEHLFTYGLWAMGLGHFLILAASLQVPARLKWREDLASLSSFNRKLMWTYGLFVVFTVISFGCLTLLLRRDLLAGTPAALGICGLIFGYWVLRVVVDYAYYGKEDWPKGPQFEIGHALLNSLFFFLVGSYGGLLLWHAIC